MVVRGGRPTKTMVVLFLSHTHTLSLSISFSLSFSLEEGERRGEEREREEEGEDRGECHMAPPRRGLLQKLASKQYNTRERKGRQRERESDESLTESTERTVRCRGFCVGRTAPLVSSSSRIINCMHHVHHAPHRPYINVRVLFSYC